MPLFLHDDIHNGIYIAGIDTVAILVCIVLEESVRRLSIDSIYHLHDISSIHHAVDMGIARKQLSDVLEFLPAIGFLIRP